MKYRRLDKIISGVFFCAALLFAACDNPSGGSDPSNANPDGAGEQTTTSPSDQGPPVNYPAKPVTPPPVPSNPNNPQIYSVSGSASLPVDPAPFFGPGAEYSYAAVLAYYDSAKQPYRSAPINNIQSGTFSWIIPNIPVDKSSLEIKVLFAVKNSASGAPQNNGYANVDVTEQDPALAPEGCIVIPEGVISGSTTRSGIFLDVRDLVVFTAKSGGAALRGFSPAEESGSGYESYISQNLELLKKNVYRVDGFPAEGIPAYGAEAGRKFIFLRKDVVITTECGGDHRADASENPAPVGQEVYYYVDETKSFQNDDGTVISGVRPIAGAVGKFKYRPAPGTDIKVVFYEMAWKFYYSVKSGEDSPIPQSVLSLLIKPDDEMYDAGYYWFPARIQKWNGVNLPSGVALGKGGVTVYKRGAGGADAEAESLISNCPSQKLEGDSQVLSINFRDIVVKSAKAGIGTEFNMYVDFTIP